MLSVPIPTAQTVFVNGFCSRPSDNVYHAGYAVVQLPDTVLEANTQAAELIALTRACQLFAGKEVNIYTNSRYAHGVVWDHGVIWLCRGYVAADGKSISHSDLVTALLDAIQLPSKLAFMHCKAHTGQMTDIAKGNALADRIAKEAASTHKADIQMPKC